MVSPPIKKANIQRASAQDRPLDSDVPSQADLAVQYQNNTAQLCTDHEKIIEKILEEEESLIASHRSQIDKVVEIVQSEMELLNQVDKPGSDVQKYVQDLDKYLLKKISVITSLRSQLLAFHTHLKTEEIMSNLYEKMRQEEESTQAESVPVQGAQGGGQYDSPFSHAIIMPQQMSTDQIIKGLKQQQCEDYELDSQECLDEHQVFD